MIMTRFGTKGRRRRKTTRKASAKGVGCLAVKSTKAIKE